MITFILAMLALGFAVEEVPALLRQRIARREKLHAEIDAFMRAGGLACIPGRHCIAPSEQAALALASIAADMDKAIRATRSP